MSDFLGNLATRALGLETSVRPRLPAIFGSPTENAFGPAPLPSDLEGEGAEDRAFAPAQSARQRRRMVAEAENLRPQSPRAIPTANRPAMAATAPERSEETASLSSNRGRESTAPAVAPPIAPDETRSVPARAEVSPPTPVANTVSPSIPTPPERIARESVREILRTEVIVPAETPARVMPRPPVPPPFAPIVKLAAPAATVFDEKRDEAAAQPTIQVTIGRVEVRAHPTPARKPTNAVAASSALSLDDYLSQREGGRR